MSGDDIIILDGGMGRELERIGAPFSQPYWSAQALMEAPEMVADVHRNFINAGAQVITTNSYAVVPPHIGDDLFKAQGPDLIALSAKLARQEADNASTNVMVAGCVPPVFGSYQPDNFDTQKAPQLLAPFFEEQAPYVDLFLAETISSLEEALMIEQVYKETGYNKPLWLAFTLQESFDETSLPQLRSGEYLCEALEKILENGIVKAVLFNCCSVEDISGALTICDQVIEARKQIKIGAYANAFGRVKGQRSPTGDISVLRDDVSPEVYLDYTKAWKKQGASIIGGCCGIGPEYIALLAKEL